MAIPTLNNSLLRLTDCIYFGDPISASVGSGFITQTRTISTTAPLTGGGDMSADRTLAITTFAGGAPGSVPTSLGGTVNFLRADGTWTPPAVFTNVANGYTPASGGGVVNYLRADGTWAIPAGTGITGLTAGQIPVAQNATTIVDSRIAQGAADFAFRTSDAGSGGAYKGLILSEDISSSAILTGTRYDGAALAAAGVRIAATDGAGGGFASAIDIYGDTVRIDGILTLNWRAAVAVNGVNDLLDVSGLDFPDKGSAFRVTGPTAAFSVGGAIPSPAKSKLSDANVCIIYNTTAQPMTIINENAGTTSMYRFATGTGANITLPGGYRSVATFLYDYSIARWVLASTSASGLYGGAAGYVPFASAAGVLSESTIFHDPTNNRYGFATPSPKATVDVNGTWATRVYDRTLSNGLNSDLPAPTTSFMRITGPTGAFSVGGVAIVPGDNGKRVTIFNNTLQAMTIVHEDASSTAEYRINTLTGANVVLPARRGAVEIVYEPVSARWILGHTPPYLASGSSTHVQFNTGNSLAGDAGLTYTGTGTDGYLTLGTDVRMSRKALRQLELGVPNALASAGQYVLTGTSSRGGTDDDVAGGDLSIGGGAGTGTGGGGNTRLQTAYPASTGNTQNLFMDRRVFIAKPVALASGVATQVLRVDITDGYPGGGTLYYTVNALDGTDTQVLSGRVMWTAVNKAGTITYALGTQEDVVAVSAGTLTAVVDMNDLSGGVANFTIDATTSLTPTTFEAWLSVAYDGKQALYLT